MMDGLHVDNGTHQHGTIGLDMVDQLGLCSSWPNDEYRTCTCDGIRDRLPIGMILRSRPAADRICLVVNVPCRMIGM